MHKYSYCPFSLCRRILFAASSTFDIDVVGLTDALFNGAQFSGGALNDWSFEPIPGAGEPPDRYNHKQTQHNDGGVVEGNGRNRGKGWEHKQYRDEDHPHDGNNTDRPAPGAQVPWPGLEVLAHKAQQNG